METTPLTQQLLKQFMTKAYDNAKVKGLLKPDLDINQELMFIITRMTYFPFSCSPAWMNTLRLQDILVQVFALAHIEGIDLVEHIKLKMQYNESRPYLHGCLY